MAGTHVSRAPGAVATLTTSTTVLVVWALGKYVFRGGMPPEVYGWLQVAVPAALGWASSELAARRQQRIVDDETL